jgi:hypothetical protein
MWEINDTILRCYSGDDVNTAQRAKSRLIGAVAIPNSVEAIQLSIKTANERIEGCLSECYDTIRRRYSGDDINTATRIKGALR